MTVSGQRSAWSTLRTSLRLAVYTWYALAVQLHLGFTERLSWELNAKANWECNMWRAMRSQAAVLMQKDLQPWLGGVEADLNQVCACAFVTSVIVLGRLQGITPTKPGMRAGLSGHQ